jgi:acetyl esterase/lipase
MTYAFDPELVPWIEMLPQTPLTDIELVRQSEGDLMAHVPVYEPPIPLDVRDLEVPGPQGDPQVPVRVYKPADADGTLPALLYIHGGGFVLGNVAMFDSDAALMWTAAHAAELGTDLERLGVGGESAGGGLAAAIALVARDRGGPALCFQLLVIPELDDRLDTVSIPCVTKA